MQDAESQKFKKAKSNSARFKPGSGRFNVISQQLLIDSAARNTKVACKAELWVGVAPTQGGEGLANHVLCPFFFRKIVPR
jgi:hypothetical protein